MLPPSSSASLLPSSPWLVSEIPAHSDERKNNNTTLQPKEAGARDSFRENSETREKRESKHREQEEELGISRGRDELVSQRNAVGSENNTEGDHSSNPNTAEKFCVLGKEAASGSLAPTDRARHTVTQRIERTVQMGREEKQCLAAGSKGAVDISAAEEGCLPQQGDLLCQRKRLEALGLRLKS